jgi:hypothetical protein
MKLYQFFWALAVLSAVIALSAFITSQMIKEDHCQIDQLCQGQFTLARQLGATDQTMFSSAKDYCFFSADYSRNMALLGEFDGRISYDKKPRLIIMHNVDERNLEYWDKLPTEYGYKKIPN